MQTPILSHWIGVLPPTMVTVEGFYCSLQVRPYASKGQTADITVWTKTLASRGCFACKLIQGEVGLKANKQYFFTQDRLHVFLDVLFTVHANCRNEACFGKRYFMSACFEVSGVYVLVQEQLRSCAEPDTSPGGNSRKALCDPYLAGCNYESLVWEKTCITAAGTLWKLS